ncbi:MAG: ABC transporter substrate-binding protein [Desulfobacterales bacterium]|nr:ABC transporter substrate-binding protein [Desulfobacterales bacterium]
MIKNMKVVTRLALGFAIALGFLVAVILLAPRGGYHLFIFGHKNLAKVSVRFPISIVEAGQTGFYVAKEKGYYTEEGLEVTFEHSTPTLGPIKAVAMEINDFGMIGGLDSLLVARGKGMPLRAIGILHKDVKFIALFSLKERGLTTIADLMNKKLGFCYGHISEDFIRSYLKNMNIPVQEVGMKYYDYSRLTSGDVDFMPGFKATVLPDMEDKGIKVNIIDPADSGMVMQGYTLFVTEDFLRMNPEIITKFLRATLRGYKDSVVNPEEGIALLVKNDPTLSAATELKRIPFYNEPMSKNPYGYMDEYMFQMTYDRLNKQGLIVTPFAIQDAFNSSFVERAAVRGANRP